MPITRRDFSQRAALAALFGGSWASALAQAAGSGAPAVAKALFTEFEDMPWKDLVPGYAGEGPKYSILYEDPKTRATQLMLRMPDEFQLPRCWHSANVSSFMMQGTLIYEYDGRHAGQGPGSFSRIPAKMVHSALARPGPEVICFLATDGPWDIHWVDGPPKPGKVMG